MTMKQVNVAVTGAAGQIGYALLFRIASGQMFGPEVAVNLQLLELPHALDALKGVCMELEDCAFPLLNTIIATDNMAVAFKDADWALLVGSVPRKAGMERNDLLKINGKIFTSQGQALSENAKPCCKVLVVGNPCNTNAYIAKHHAKNLKQENFFALMMLDQKRATCQIANKAKCNVTDIDNLIVWGNHSATQYPDIYNATIFGKKAMDIIQDEKWIKNEFLVNVQQRGSAIIKARGLSSAASAANAVVETVKNIENEIKGKEPFSVAISSDGSYGIEKGILFGFPVVSDSIKCFIKSDFSHNEYSLEKIKETYNELLMERDAVSELLK